MALLMAKLLNEINKLKSKEKATHAGVLQEHGPSTRR